MKKFKVFLIIIAVFLLIYFLQINFFSWFNIAGVMPNLFAVFVLFIGLFVGEKTGILFGLIFGLILDYLVGKSIGPSAILFAIIGYIGEYFDKNFSKDNRINLILMSAGSLCIYEIGMYVFNIARYRIPIEIMPFITKLLIENIFNIFIIIILSTLIQRLGYYLEDSFKGRKFKTRYF